MKVAILLSILSGELPMRPHCCLTPEVRAVYAEIYGWKGSKKLENGIKNGTVKPVRRGALIKVATITAQ